MGMDFMGKDGEMRIPAGWAAADKELLPGSMRPVANSAVTQEFGFVNELISQNRQLAEDNKRLIEEVRALRAAPDAFGMSKICPLGLTDATQNDGSVLGWTEKNASIPGTVANWVATSVADVQNQVNTVSGRIRSNMAHIPFNNEGIVAITKSVLKDSYFTDCETRMFNFYSPSTSRYIAMQATIFPGRNYSGWAFLYGTSSNVWFFHYASDVDSIERFELPHTRIFN